jgi:hypothetical protein
VLNSPDVEGCERFTVEKLGFKVSDRTGHMRFVRCNRKHHALAYAKSDYKVGSPDDWKWPPGRIDHWSVQEGRRPDLRRGKGTPLQGLIPSAGISFA